MLFNNKELKLISDKKLYFARFNSLFICRCFLCVCLRATTNVAAARIHSREKEREITKTREREKRERVYADVGARMARSRQDKAGLQ